MDLLNLEKTEGPEESRIPILIICFNNYKFVKQMILQLETYISNPNIIVINNQSSCVRTFKYLNSLGNDAKYKIINCDRNYGHNVWFQFLDKLPRRFIVTDPDLEFNPKMPPNFIEVLLELNQKYNTARIGLAIDISDSEKMFPYSFSDYGYQGVGTIHDSQLQFWKTPIVDGKYEIYEAEIDTTFFLFDKQNSEGISIRVGGNFKMKHLPWYIEIDGVSRYERIMMYDNCNDSSSIKCFEYQYLKDNHFAVIKKYDELYLIQLEEDEDSDSDKYWIDVFPSQDEDLFNLFYLYLNPNQQYLDIGSGVGNTAIYASRKVSEIVCVEANPHLLQKLKKNLEINRTESIIHIESEVIHNSSEVGTITFDQIIEKYNLTNLCFIKMDIGGNEENILPQVLNYIYHKNIPTYVRFYYDQWRDKNLERFEFSQDVKDKIKDNPFCSILFR